MNKRKVIRQLKQQYPGKNILCIPPTGRAKEIICELGPIEGGSRAIAVIDESEAHVHFRTTEIYDPLEDGLTLQYDSSDKAGCLSLTDKVLKKGETFTIRPGTVHKAKGKAVWIQVDTFPAWSPDDHHLCKEHFLIADE